MDLAFVVYTVLGFAALGIWLYAEWSWIRVLASANGTRPFVRATVRVAHIMTIMSAIFALSPLIWDSLRPDDTAEYIVRDMHRVLAILACVAMLRLHHRIEEITHKVVSEE